MMNLTIEEKKQDASYKLVEKGFFVEHPTRPITLDTIPMDGSEFIHRSRLEDAQLSYCVDLNVNSLTESQSAESSMKSWGRKRAKEFTNLSLELKANKLILIRYFPKKLKFPEGEDDKKWCIFCLGSKMFSEIFGEDLPNKKKGHLPFLSIVVHLSQEQIMMLISYFYKWVEEVGLNDDMGRWIYALFVVLEKPVDEIFQEKLEAFHDHCKKIVSASEDESIKYRIYLVVSLLKHCFCVKSHKVGPDGERYFQTFKLIKRLN